jgi:hypothetical protein
MRYWTSGDAIARTPAASTGTVEIYDVTARRWETAPALDAWPGVDPRWQPVSAVVALEQVATRLMAG